MQLYIEQLVTDIRNATWNMRPPHQIWQRSQADPDNELEEEDISYVEEAIYGTPEPIAEITTIPFEQLPPPEQLTSAQQATLSVELEKLLINYNFKLDFPATYPHELRYPIIRNFWLESHVPLSFGTNHIELCDLDESACPFPGHCTTCAEVAAQMKFDEEQAQKNTQPAFDTNIDIEFIRSLLPTNEDMKNFGTKENPHIDGSIGTDN